MSMQDCAAMPRESAPNSAVGPALIEAAARLIATEGASGLTLRRVAEEVGTSTMAVYTHFGGMPELRRAVRNGSNTIQMAQLLAPEEALRGLEGAVLNLFIAYGDDADAARRSLARAWRGAGKGQPAASEVGSG